MPPLSRKEILRQVDPTGRVVVLDGAVTLTHEYHAGRILLMSVDPAAATTFTLPEAAGTGNVFHFKVGILNTSKYVISRAGSDLIDGSLTNISTTNDNEEGFQAENEITITLDGDAQGGFRPGDWVELTDILINQWTVRGQTTTNSASGTTPFASS